MNWKNILSAIFFALIGQAILARPPWTIEMDVNGRQNPHKNQLDMFLCYKVPVTVCISSKYV